MPRTKKQKISISEGECRHHTVWEEKEFKGRIKKGFRDYPAFVVPMPSEALHLELHKSIQPWKFTPTRDEMIDCTEVLGMQPDYIKSRPLWGLEVAAKFFGSLVVGDSFDDLRRQRIATHFTLQLDFLVMNAALVAPTAESVHIPAADPVMH